MVTLGKLLERDSSALGSDKTDYCLSILYRQSDVSELTPLSSLFCVDVTTQSTNFADLTGVGEVAFQRFLTGDMLGLFLPLRCDGFQLSQMWVSCEKYFGIHAMRCSDAHALS